MNNIQINNIEELKEYLLANSFEGDFFIKLKYGIHSHKHISYMPDIEKPFYVFNEIDGSENYYTDEQMKMSHIGDNMKTGNFFITTDSDN